MRSERFLLTLAVIILCSFSAEKPLPSDKKATKETIVLSRSLFELQKIFVMYVHQDDLMYGYNWWYEKERSDTKEFTGDYPAVAGFELGHLELGVE